MCPDLTHFREYLSHNMNQAITIRLSRAKILSFVQRLRRSLPARAGARAGDFVPHPRGPKFVGPSATHSVGRNTYKNFRKYRTAERVIKWTKFLHFPEYRLNRRALICQRRRE
jgi:hypothetical protein